MATADNKKLEYKATFSVIEYKPEFLEWYSKRQAELYKRIRKLDDEIAADSQKQTYTLLPTLAFIGGLLGAVIGLLIGGLL